MNRKIIFFTMMIGVSGLTCLGSTSRYQRGRVEFTRDNRDNVRLQVILRRGGTDYTMDALGDYSGAGQGNWSRAVQDQAVKVEHELHDKTVRLVERFNRCRHAQEARRTPLEKLVTKFVQTPINNIRSYFPQQSRVVGHQTFRLEGRSSYYDGPQGQIRDEFMEEFSPVIASSGEFAKLLAMQFGTQGL